MAAPDLYGDGRTPADVRLEPKTTNATGRVSPAADGRSIGELFSELADETRTLIRQELELAKTEMTEKATRVGKDVGMMGAGGAIAYMGAYVLIAAAVIGLGHLIGYGLSALIIGLVIVGVGAMVAMKGKNDLQKASLSPDRTKETVKETKQWMKEQTR